jgi:hypothetical protein
MTHSQMRSAPDPLEDAGELAGGVGGVGAAVVGAAGGLAMLGVGEGGAGVGDSGALAVGGALASGEVVATAPLAACTHAVARQPLTRMAAASGTFLTRRRIPGLSTCLILA